MEEALQKSREWFKEKANTAQARVWLAVLSFTESCVFIIPPDPLLAAMVFVHENRWVRYTLITAGASIAGAVFGYVVGAALFEFIGTRLVDIYNLHDYMDQAVTLIDESVFVFTLTAAFTPIPFKVAVLAAGFAKANFIAFLTAVVIGRVARYAFVAYVAKIFGAHAEHIFKKFWWYATIGGGIIIVLYAAYLLFL